MKKKQKKKESKLRRPGYERPKGLLDLVDRISTPFTPKDYEILTSDEKPLSQQARKAKAMNGFKLKKFELLKD